MTYMIYYEMSDKDWEQSKRTYDFAHTITGLKEVLKMTDRTVTKIVKLYKNGKGIDISNQYLNH